MPDTSSDMYWGFPSSPMNECEDDYAVVPYVAEFWSALGDLFILVVVACGLLRTARGNDSFSQKLFVALGLAGTCSLVNHVTLHHIAYRFDVVSMGCVPLLLLHSPVLQPYIWPSVWVRNAMWFLLLSFGLFVDFRQVDSVEQLFVPSWFACIISGLCLAAVAVFNSCMWDAFCLLTAGMAALAMGFDRALPCSDDTFFRRIPWHALWHVLAGVFSHHMFHLHMVREGRLREKLRQN